MSGSYEVGVVRTVRAMHVMPFDEGPEGRPHDHDYRVEVVVRTEGLDARGMALDLLDLEAAVDGALERVRDRDLEAIRPSALPAVTVEVFARWVHDQVRDRLAGGDIAVRIWEHDEAFGGYAGAG
jgi:6-pyruvoyl-tetrahydropterin synthase